MLLINIYTKENCPACVHAKREFPLAAEGREDVELEFRTERPEGFRRFPVILAWHNASTYRYTGVLKKDAITRWIDSIIVTDGI